MTKQLTPLEAYNRLCSHLDYDNSDYMHNGSYEEDNDIIETALKDFEWLKHKLNLRFLNSLSSPEDKMRVMKIMGFEYGKEN